MGKTKKMKLFLHSKYSVQQGVNFKHYVILTTTRSSSKFLDFNVQNTFNFKYRLPIFGSRPKTNYSQIKQKKLLCSKTAAGS